MIDNAHDLCIRQTRSWLKTVIIDLNFCPFAHRVFENETIHYQHVDNSDIEYCLRALIDECLQLDSNDVFETSLLIFSQAFSSFDDFLDLIAMANTLLIDRGYEGIYQLAHFHPDYHFADVTKDDAANYTNRSPWPMLHIIRESSLEQALKHYPDPETIPEHNIKVTRAKGSKEMQTLLDACYKQPEY
ncbi:MAG: DUF1415 domain-containing protein [Gammaproteobacteria bacterium]|nr:DUF1415 domain-containing protein [Gammaproteobacteria bacterium]